MSDVSADVMAIIQKRLPADKQGRALTRDDHLDELGLDSFAAIEMIFDLEEKFDIEIPYNSNDARLQFATVGEVVDGIQKLVDG